MDEIFAELAAALKERLKIISDETSRRDSARHMARLQRASERIEEIEHRLPAETDPQLRHFLLRRSYGKALEFAEGSTSRS